MLDAFFSSTSFPSNMSKRRVWEADRYLDVKKVPHLSKPRSVKEVINVVKILPGNKVCN